MTEFADSIGDFEELGILYRTSVEITERVNVQFRKLSFKCPYRSVVEPKNLDEAEWHKCNHSDHTYARASITTCEMRCCPLMKKEKKKKPEVENDGTTCSILEEMGVTVKRMDENCFESGLNMWECEKCQIGILELTLDTKPDECPSCKNKNLKRRED